MDGPFLADTFSSLEDARPIAAALVLEPDCPFAFAEDARIAYVLQQPQLLLHGQPADAYITQLKVQGSNRLLWEFLATQFLGADGEAPDFLVYLDAVSWEMRGRDEERGVGGCPLRREALIYHELCHLRHLETPDGEPRFHADGRAMLALQRHTYEFFQEEIRRYGPATLRLDQVGLDYLAGAKEEKARRRRSTRHAA